MIKGYCCWRFKGVFWSQEFVMFWQFLQNPRSACYIFGDGCCVLMILTEPLFCLLCIFFIFRLPLELLPLSTPLTHWCASTPSTALLCSSWVALDWGLFISTQSICNVPCANLNIANWIDGHWLRHIPCKMVSDAIKYNIISLSNV